jgi:sporadic carbohydrate cluster 2OG-Fe(II) oxygenase
MSVVRSFVTEADASLANEFLERGYVIRPVEDRASLDALRAEVCALLCGELGVGVPDDIGAFLDTIHTRLKVADLNRVRLAVYRAMNERDWFRPTYFHLARGIVSALVGNELAMQNRVNLSIQFPQDDSSLLDIHADVFGGETPFQVVEWLPLTDCRRTKSMFILPAPQTEAITPRLAEIGDGGMAHLYEMVEKDLVWLDVPYGTVLVFSPNCLHGNVRNDEAETRWSMNCRLTGLFTPYTSPEKKIGSYYLPITTRPVSRVGMRYLPPGGFEE